MITCYSFDNIDFFSHNKGDVSTVRKRGNNTAAQLIHNEKATYSTYVEYRAPSVYDIIYCPRARGAPLTLL